MRMRFILASVITILPLVFAPVRARAADPLTAGATLAAIGSAIGLIRDVVTMVDDVIRLTGEYEEQLTSLKIRSYSERTDGLYRQAHWYRQRDYWIDPNGEGHYRTLWLQAQPDGTRRPVTSTDPFQYLVEHRNYLCQIEYGTWERLTTRTTLALGYEVVKPTDISRLCAPNPMKVRIDWAGVTLPARCGGTSESQSVITENEAPRRAFRPLRFPRNDFEVYSAQLTPRLR